MTTALTLNGHKVTSARVNIPAWGAWFADVSIDGEVTLSGAVSLVVADVTYKGTILSGGPSTGRSHFRIVGGAAGWGKTIAKKSYANDLNIRLSAVLKDAATECGETLDASTVDPSARVGVQFVRPAAPASRLLEEYASGAWYIDENGTTKLGARAASTLPAHVTRTTPIDLAAGKLEIASDTLAGIVPGLQVDGLDVVDVVHEVSAKGGLRSTLYGKVGGKTSRRLEAWKGLFEALDPRRKFRSVWEYRIVTLEGNRANLQAVLASSGMPDLTRVVVRPGVPGTKAQHVLGSRVLVGFMNEDPGRPFIFAFEDADSDGFVPVSLALAGGGPAIGRVGDSVSVTIDATAAGKLTAPSSGGPCTLTGGSFSVTGTITGGSTKVTCG